jgi:hypothetical protein
VLTQELPIGPPGPTGLTKRTRLDSVVRAAAFESPVDVARPCFRGANLVPITTPVDYAVGLRPMSKHRIAVARRYLPAAEADG